MSRTEARELLDAVRSGAQHIPEHRITDALRVTGDLQTYRPQAQTISGLRDQVRWAELRQEMREATA